MQVVAGKNNQLDEFVFVLGSTNTHQLKECLRNTKRSDKAMGSSA